MNKRNTHEASGLMTDGLYHLRSLYIAAHSGRLE